MRALHHVRVIWAAAFWMLAVSLMVEATVDGDVILRGWAVLSALGASVPTLWIIIDHAANMVCRSLERAMHEERMRTEELVLAVACEFAQSEVPRLDARRRPS